MRISDWSSDVCSSDLLAPGGGGADAPVVGGFTDALEIGDRGDIEDIVVQRATDARRVIIGAAGQDHRPARCAGGGDRKSVVAGKSVSVRVTLGVLSSL